MSEAITADIPLKPPVLGLKPIPLKPEPPPKPDPAPASAVAPPPEPPGFLTKLFAVFGVTLTRRQATVAASAVASLLVGIVGVRAVMPPKAAPVNQPLAETPKPPAAATPADAIQPAGGLLAIPTAPDIPPATATPPAAPPLTLPTLPSTPIVDSKPPAVLSTPPERPIGPAAVSEQRQPDKPVPPAAPPPYSPTTPEFKPAAQVSASTPPVDLTAKPLAPPLSVDPLAVPAYPPANSKVEPAGALFPVPKITAPATADPPPNPPMPPTSLPTPVAPPLPTLPAPTPPVTVTPTAPAVPPVVTTPTAPPVNLAPPLSVTPPAAVPPVDMGAKPFFPELPATPPVVAPPVVPEPAAFPPSVPRVEFTKPAAAIEPTPTPLAVSRSAPTTTFDVDLHPAKASDTYESISREHYSDAKYAAALRQFNKGRALANGASVEVPPIHVLKRQFPGAIGTPTAGAPPQWGTATPAPVTPTGGRAPEFRAARGGSYTVPATGATIKQIARATLGDDERWREVWDLNPHLRADDVLPPGTVVKLPSDARGQ